MMKNYNYNELVRFYNRSQKKLSNLLALGKNIYKQDILKRRIARLFQLLTGMQNSLKLQGATFALAAGFVLFQPNAASAQSFPVKLSNQFGLASVPNSTTSVFSTPGFVDLDNDGDKDILAGNSDGDFYYYKNIGTISAPSYSAGVLNPYGLANNGGYYSSPVFVDLDNDGDKDMFSGTGAGDVVYYKNTGTATAPSFSASVNNPFGITAMAATYSAGAFTDLDNDGDLDFLCGDKAGDFFYFPNIGTVSAPSFGPAQTNPFGLVTNLTAGYATVTFTDLDSDGDKDLWTGDSGSFTYYKNTGTASAPSFTAPVNNPMAITSLTASGASLSFTDLDNDGDQDFISGVADGAIWYFKNTFGTGISTNNLAGGVSLYPNPTNCHVNLSVKNPSEVLSIEVSNVLGQVISTTEIITEINTINLPDAKGLYFVKLTDVSNKSNTFKVVKD